jgi:purine-binding chemotaxis protein CheW
MKSDQQQMAVAAANDLIGFNQFVTFMIENENYGVNVLDVQEIIGMTQITHLPNAPAFMRGVINLRGTVVPVIDMRLKFRMNEKTYDQYTVILIIEINSRLIGMIVDSVSDVIVLNESNIQEMPDFTASIDREYIMKIGTLDDSLIILLNVEKIFSGEDIEKIQNSGDDVDSSQH